MKVTLITENKKCKTYSLNRGAFIIIIFLCASECHGLRLSNMTAPLIQDPRENMRLFCEFDMEGEELYAVKWYKDDHEFFRYSPAGNDRLLYFQVIGVHVNPSEVRCTLSSCNLVLDDLSRTFSSGAYRCEVSTEAPTFRLASQTHNITVAVIPLKNPTIDGVKDHYLVGDLLVATCSSGLGDPKPSIAWYINRRLVSNKSTRELQQRPDSFHPENQRIKLMSTTVQLRFPLDKALLKKSPSVIVELTCVQSSDILGYNFISAHNTTKLIRLVTGLMNDHQRFYGLFGSASQQPPADIFIAISTLMFLIH